MANSVATGSIKSIHAENHTLTLADGTQFTVPEAFSTAELGVGDHVKIHYNTVGSDKVVSAINIT